MNNINHYLVDKMILKTTYFDKFGIFKVSRSYVHNLFSIDDTDVTDMNYIAKENDVKDTVYDFMKFCSYSYYPQKVLAEFKDDVIRFAQLEGLGAHANSIRVRFEPPRPSGTPPKEGKPPRPSGTPPKEGN